VAEKHDFIKFCELCLESSYSQNLQDLWGLWENSNTPNFGFFVEFGALSGINVSNSYLMERLGWNGIVAEPHPNYRDTIIKNRSCYKEFDAVYSKTGEELVFKSIKGFPALSTLEVSQQFDNEINNERRQNALTSIVKTISLEDMLDKFNAPKLIDYISIDTEGSEWDILKVFNFDKYSFRSICVEYGTDEKRDKIYGLLTKAGYTRKWEDLSEHDDWYVHSDHQITKKKNVSEVVNLVNNQKHDLMSRAKNRLTKKLASYSIELEMPRRSKGLQYRLELTKKCKDADYLPKVENAGKVFQDENGSKFQVLHNGVKAYPNGYVGPWITKLIDELKGHHEPQQEVVFHEILKLIKNPKPVMVELGCEWAYYTNWFKKEFPNSVAICAEPNLEQLEFAKANATLNAHKNIHFHHAFNGNEDRFAKLIDSDNKNLLSKEFLAIEDIFSKYKLDCIDILFLDVQGAETDVISEAYDLLSEGKIKFLIVSTHVHYISKDSLTHQKCLNMIKLSAGRIIAEYEVHESYSGDGLIAACYDKDISLPEVNISYCRYSESKYRNPAYDLFAMTKRRAVRKEKKQKTFK